MQVGSERQLRAVLVCALIAVALFFLYFYNLTAMGMVGPDEPRYAAIGREMARSGDWVTPRLWGEPWFEKPALLYWMTAAATLMGLGPDLAPRLPVALLSVAFLGFYYWILRREFGPRAALYAAMILGTSAWWIAFSQVGTTDLPMAATFSAAMLLLLPWLRTRDRRWLWPAAALLGLAVLAKSLVPAVLALPVAWFGRKQWPDLLRPAVIAAFALVALPWYVWCAYLNGWPFLQTLFVEHQFGRVASDALQHVRPFWYYIPVMAGALFPWVLLVPLLFRRELYSVPGARFLLAIVLFGFVFFSAVLNKLPGYVLPLLPALAALLGLALDRARFPAGWLAWCTILLALVPVVGWVLPTALESGIRHAYPIDLSVRGAAGLLMPVLIMAGGIELLADRAGRRTLAVSIVCGITILSVAWLKWRIVPRVDEYTARPAWRAASAREASTCAGHLNRNLRYGLNYYFGTNLPDCGPDSAVHITEQDGKPVVR